MIRVINGYCGFNIILTWRISYLDFAKHITEFLSVLQVLRYPRVHRRESELRCSSSTDLNGSCHWHATITHVIRGNNILAIITDLNPQLPTLCER
ncbi:hypothetical protein D3C74_418800 [compost metagenome]